MLAHSSAARSCRPCPALLPTVHSARQQRNTLHGALRSQHAVGPARQLTEHAQGRCTPPARTAAARVVAGLQKPSKFLTLQQPHPFASCMKLMLSKAAMQPTQQHQQAIACLEQQQRPDDYWLLVECGTWDGHPDMPVGWTGPARSIMQCWVDGLCVDYTLWMLDEHGLPNGDKYYSGRELELLTSRWNNKKFQHSVSVLQEGKPSGTVLKTWMAHVLGVTELVRKVRNANSPAAKKSLNEAAREEEKRAKGAAAGQASSTPEAQVGAAGNPAGSKKGSGAGDTAASGTSRVRRSRRRPRGGSSS